MLQTNKQTNRTVTEVIKGVTWSHNLARDRVSVTWHGTIDNVTPVLPSLLTTITSLLRQSQNSSFMVTWHSLPWLDSAIATADLIRQLLSWQPCSEVTAFWGYGSLLVLLLTPSLLLATPFCVSALATRFRFCFGQPLLIPDWLWKTAVRYRYKLGRG